MNNNRKKLALVQRILKQAIKISTTSIIDVFVDYASHVQSLTVKVYLKGWDEQKEPDLREYIYLNNTFLEEHSIAKLENIEKYLKNLK